MRRLSRISEAATRTPAEVVAGRAAAAATETAGRAAAAATETADRAVSQSDATHA